MSYLLEASYQLPSKRALFYFSNAKQNRHYTKIRSPKCSPTSSTRIVRSTQFQRALPMSAVDKLLQGRYLIVDFFTFNPPNTAFPFDGTVSNSFRHNKFEGPSASLASASCPPPVSSFSNHGSFSVSMRLSLGLLGWEMSSWRVRGHGQTNPRFVFHAALLAAL